jgi:hypothetical protein
MAILIFSSETAYPNEPKFSRKLLWKIFYKYFSFHPDSTHTWSPWAILVFDWLKFKIFSSETRRWNKTKVFRYVVTIP